MPRPDVALVAPYPRPGAVHAGTSGVASYTANLARGLTGAGADVRVIAPHEHGCGAFARDGAIVVQRAFRPGPAAGLAALQAARATGARVVHLQFELFLYGLGALPGLLAALALLRRAPARTVVTMHQVVDPATVDADFVRLHGISAPPALARAALAALQAVLPRLADVVIVHEPAFAGHVPGSVVVPHGIELVARDDRAEARDGLGIARGRFCALCFGFLAPYKGLDLACAAAELAGDDVELVVAGGEHPRHGGERSYGRRLRERYGHRVRFAGYVPEPEIARWFAAADVALLPYPRPHASSGALALALAHGTPALMSRPLAACVGASDRLAVDADPAALAERLTRLARDAAALDEVRADTIRLAAGRAWPEVAHRHLELYAG